MLDDRDYMRPDHRSYRSYNFNWPLRYWLMGSLVVAFFVQTLISSSSNFPINKYFALSVEGLEHGFVWQLVTFQFLHANLQHIFGNLITLWFFANPVEERLGKTHFLRLYLLSGVAGGLLQFLVMLLFPQHFGVAPVVGASAGIFGLVAAFALMNRNETVYLNLLIPIRAIYFLYGEIAYAVYSMIRPSGFVADAAHLGGIIFAAAYIRWGLDLSRNLSELNPFQKKMRRERMIKAANARPSFPKLRSAKPDDAEEAPSEEFISSQVDPILDKISAQGIQSLTDKERKILQAARSRMSKR